MENVTLEQDNGLLLSVSPRGAMAHGCANVKTGERLLYPFFVREDEKERGGCPICFPAFGSPAPVYTGEKQHGWLRNTLVSTVKRHFSVSSLGFHRIGGLYAGRVAYHIMHTLYPQKISSHLQFVVSDELGQSGSVLVRPAFHPYFPNDGKAEVEINGVTYTEFTDQARCIMLDGKKDIVIDTGDVQIRMILEGFDPEVACVYLWSDAPEKYFCVEPVVCSRENFFNGSQLRAYVGLIYEFGMSLEMIK